MNLLPTTFRHDGRCLQQLQRTSKVAIYQLIGENNVSYGYEVIRITVEKARERFGRILPEREIYPADSKFGSLAWSFGKNKKNNAFERCGMYVRAEGEELTPAAASRVLGTEFRYGQTVFKQLKREGRVALYKVMGAGYEVVIIQRQSARTIGGYSYPEREVMPNISAWGQQGWTYLAQDLAGAERRYQSLLPKWGEQSILSNSLNSIVESAGRLTLPKELEVAACC